MACGKRSLDSFTVHPACYLKMAVRGRSGFSGRKTETRVPEKGENSFGQKWESNSSLFFSLPEPGLRFISGAMT